MIIELGGRSTGKTKRMIEWLKADAKRILLVANQDLQIEAFDRFELEKDVKDRVVTYFEYFAWHSAIEGGEVAIDDIDCFLKELFKANVAVISMRTETASDPGSELLSLDTINMSENAHKDANIIQIEDDSKQ